MEYQLPELGEGIYEAELVAWHVKPGDVVKRGQSLAEVLTDKASMELPAGFTGTIEALHAEAGSQVKVGEVILTYKATAAASEPTPTSTPTRQRTAAAAEPKRAPASTASATALGVKAAPSVRLMARQLGIDLTRVKGSGPGGRILVADLTNAGTPAVRPVSATPPPDYGKPGMRIKLQGIRRRIAEHMTLAKRTIPHFAYVDEADVTDLVRLRTALKEPLARTGVKLTYLAFFVKAVVEALKEVPICNATLDEEGQEIVVHDRYHIGIAVAAPQGLLVPVIHDADRKSLQEIAREIDRLGEEARNNKLKVEELRGGTFTISSIGGIGGLISTPIIPHPQVGIMGVGKVVKRPVYDAQLNIRPADVVYLSFSFDHRVLDGAVAAVFGNAVIRRLQAPGALLL
jgi:pyruvate dehydrogenase E2 component (dihydrolipoamide acetyltransferase)/2-oxoisovalerate dehydrogenase E2 component (dihydrolipoyl transacylase)